MHNHYRLETRIYDPDSASGNDPRVWGGKGKCFCGMVSPWLEGDTLHKLNSKINRWFMEHRKRVK